MVVTPVFSNQKHLKFHKTRQVQETSAIVILTQCCVMVVTPVFRAFGFAFGCVGGHTAKSKCFFFLMKLGLSTKKIKMCTVHDVVGFIFLFIHTYTHTHIHTII